MLNLIDKIMNFILHDANYVSILQLNGCFGSGKSYLLDEVKDILYKSEHNNLIIYDYQHNKQIEYIHEFVFSLAMSYVGGFENNPQETFILRNKFHELLNHFKLGSKYLFNDIKHYNKLKNIPSFKIENSEQYIKSYSELVNSENYEILFNSYDLLAEKFLEDFISRHLDHNKLEKLRILFIFDNYDIAAGTINYWIINHLIKLLDKNINSIKYRGTNKNHNLRDIFYFKFIFSTRDKFKFDHPEAHYDSIDLQPFTNEQIVDYFLKRNIDIRDSIEFIKKFTNGIPFMLCLVSEAILLNDGEINDYSEIESVAVQRALNYLTEEQKDYIRAASFLEYFDEEVLEFMPLIKDKYREAYDFLVNSNELCEKIEDKYYSIKKFLKDLIINDLKNESPSVAKNLEIISNLVQNYKIIFKVFEPDERKIVRVLSYFKCFDKIITIQEIFGDEAPKARKVIDRYPTIFYEKNGLYFVDEKLSNAVLSLEKLSSTTLFETTLNKIKQSWQKYLEQHKKDLNNSKFELEAILQKLEELKNQENQLKVETVKIESDLELLTREINQTETLFEKYKHDTNLFYLIAPLIFLIFVLLNDVYNFVLIDFIYSLIIIILLSIFILNRVIVFFKIWKNRLNYNNLSNLLNKLKSKKNEFENKVISLKDKKSKLTENINIYSNLLDKLKYDIEIIKFKINNRFYYE